MVESNSKLIRIEEAAALIKDGDTLGIGGNVLHRAPMALVREIARRGAKNLRLVKAAGALDIDLLCFAGCVSYVDAGFVGYESKYLMADHYRAAVQNGGVRANEHSCYTLIAALRAAKTGNPFMPVKGLAESDLIEPNDYFTRIADPFTGEMVTIVKAIVPDVCILHAHWADEKGNAAVYPPQFEDILFSRAAKKAIVSAEKIVPESYTRQHSEAVGIPHFLVQAVVEAPQGAAPCSCPPEYDIDGGAIERFKALKTREELDGWLKGYEYADRKGGAW